MPEALCYARHGCLSPQTLSRHVELCRDMELADSVMTEKSLSRLRNLCRDRRSWEVYHDRDFSVVTENTTKSFVTENSLPRRNSYVAATCTRSIARKALVVHVQARTVGSDRKHCRNTSPELYRDIKCLSWHTVEQPFSRQKIFYRDCRWSVVTEVFLSRQASVCRTRESSVVSENPRRARALMTIELAAALTALLLRAVALPCRDTKSPIATQGPRTLSRQTLSVMTGFLCRDRGLKTSSSPFWPPALPVPFFLFFFLSFPKHPKFNIT